MIHIDDKTTVIRGDRNTLRVELIAILRSFLREGIVSDKDEVAYMAEIAGMTSEELDAEVKSQFAELMKMFLDTLREED